MVKRGYFKGVVSHLNNLFFLSNTIYSEMSRNIYTKVEDKHIIGCVAWLL